MPATRAQLRKPKVVAHVVDFGDETTVTFWYDRNKITDAWMGEWRTHEEQSNAPKLNEMLADLIERWDIYEDGAETVPVQLSAASIGELFSLPAKVFLMGELFTAGVPSRAEGEVSSAPSSLSPRQESPGSTPQQPESQPMPLNGADASPSPAPSASPSPT